MPHKNMGKQGMKFGTVDRVGGTFQRRVEIGKRPHEFHTNSLDLNYSQSKHVNNWQKMATGKELDVLKIP